MTPLNLPIAPLQLKRMNGTVYVDCLIRRKKLVLTPEEWVCQHVINFLIEVTFHLYYQIQYTVKIYSNP